MIDLSTDHGLAVGIALVAAGVCLYVIYPALAIVHEWTHAATLERLGYSSRTVLDGPEIAGRVWPTRGGYVEPAPFIQTNDMASREILAVSLAPLAIVLATSPIPLYLAIDSSTSVIPLLVGWTIVFGPSSGDWQIAIDELCGLEPMRFEPAIDDDSAHVLAEGIE